MTDLDDIRARHVPCEGQHPMDGPDAPRHCNYTMDDWPCDTATVLAALTDCDDALSIVEGAVTDRDHLLDAAEAREARLREALDGIMDTGGFFWRFGHPCRWCEAPPPESPGYGHDVACPAAKAEAALSPEAET